MKNIAVVTGTRAEYGILYPVIKAIEAKPELRLCLIATGMHLSHEFGYTLSDIETDGLQIDAKIDMLLSNDTPASMAKSLGLGIINMSQAWEQLKPEIILILGDRIESFAAAVSGAYMNIPVAHIHGGDSSKGGLDESARHAITKFAHIHFPATKLSAERIIKLGEDEWRVHVVGSPAMDTILNEPLLPEEAVVRQFKLDLSQPLVLLIQHPVTTQVHEAAEQMRETLSGIVELGYPTILIFPNSDAGGRSMIEVIKQYEGYPFIKIAKSLPRKEYLSLIKIANVMVGNSSSGMVDAPSFGLPVVNIGIRQEGRERGKNVIDVGHDKYEIINAMEKALADEDFLKEVRKCKNPYGDGKAGQRIADILAELEITPQLLQKKITY